MTPSIDSELVELVEFVAPPLIDLVELDRLVAEDATADAAFDGECAEHPGCQPVFGRRLA